MTNHPRAAVVPARWTLPCRNRGESRSCKASARPRFAQHRERAAIVYVRQSTPQQVIGHQESGLRQYDLAAHAMRWAGRSNECW